MQNLTLCDQQHSVLASADTARSYPPYGALPAAIGPRLAYCGQAREASTGFYHLGNGYRSYDPCLMRFLSPDALSPFVMGGINAYAYCAGDPINYQDRNGRIKTPVKHPIGGANLAPDWTPNKSQRAMRVSEASTSTPVDFKSDPTPGFSGPDEDGTHKVVMVVSGAASTGHGILAHRNYREGNTGRAALHGFAALAHGAGVVTAGLGPFMSDNPTYQVFSNFMYAVQGVASIAAFVPVGASAVEAYTRTVLQGFSGSNEAVRGDARDRESVLSDLV